MSDVKTSARHKIGMDLFYDHAEFDWAGTSPAVTEKIC